MKKIIFLFVLLVVSIKIQAQFGASSLFRLKINSPNTYSRVAMIDPNGYLYAFPNGTDTYVLTMNGSNVAWMPKVTANIYKGTWDASTNTPPLSDGTGTAGWYYRVTVGGTQNLGSGNITFNVGDDVYYNGSIWQRVPGQGYTLQPATSSVLGGVKIGSGVTVQLDGTISVNTNYIPTSHTVYNISNGTGFLKNNGSGVWSYDNSTYATQDWANSRFDKYNAWIVYNNGSSYGAVFKEQYVNFIDGNGIKMVAGGSVGSISMTSNLSINTMGTIANPDNTYVLPIQSSGGTTAVKIAVSNFERLLGTTTGTASRLVMRDASSDAYAHNFILSSDRRLKKNIIDLPNTDWTNKIEFKQFQFKDDPKEKTRYGVIAQDIEKIAPQLVSTDEQGNKAVAYIDLLIAKIAEMDKQIKSLQNEVEKLKNR